MEIIKRNYRLIVFAIYVILMTLGVTKHEPWLDEAQAWLLAKDVTIKELFVKYLRYEGSPGLWHLILMIPAKLGLPYITLNIIAAVISALGVLLFLYFSPFPIVIKVLFPFTYFAFYQYGIVARSYCLIPVLLFWLAIIYNRRMEKPFQFILVLCLLANVSAHTFLIVGSIVFLHFISFVQSWKELDKRTRQNNIAAFAIYGSMSLALVFVLIPPHDQLFTHSIRGSLHDFLYSLRMVAGALVLDETSPAYWFQIIISAVIFVYSVLWLIKNKIATLYLLPLAILVIFSATMYRNFWHEGVLFLLWIFVLWISFSNTAININRPIRKYMTTAIVIVFMMQTIWTISALKYDYKNRYSASKGIANYLKAVGTTNRKIFATGWKTISILPYFDKHIFYNQKRNNDFRFWFWSSQNRSEVGYGYDVYLKICEEQPDLIIVALQYFWSTTKIQFEGYKPVGVFDGNLWWKTNILERESYYLFKKEKQDATKTLSNNSPFYSFKRDCSILKE